MNLLAKHFEGHIWVPMALVARDPSPRSLSVTVNWCRLEGTLLTEHSMQTPAKITRNSMQLLDQRIPCGRTRRGGERNKHVRSFQPHWLLGSKVQEAFKGCWHSERCRWGSVSMVAGVWGSGCSCCTDQKQKKASEGWVPFSKAHPSWTTSNKGPDQTDLLKTLQSQSKTGLLKYMIIYFYFLSLCTLLKSIWKGEVGLGIEEML